jgi:TPP-dependent pyruvate/acetoin dehydrogenase alpha subunit
MTKEELIAFEDEVAGLFNAGKIRSPIHLSKNNEDRLIEIFKKVKTSDYVFSNHRSHYHYLLKTGNKEWLMNEILANRSIHINDSKNRFFSSAIVAGCCPIALGVALSIKRRGGSEQVWCFIGDMAFYTGIAHESIRYAAGFDLPITFICEDNGLSVNTPTHEVWGSSSPDKVITYKYERQVPHSGTGKWLKF